MLLHHIRIPFDTLSEYNRTKGQINTDSTNLAIIMSTDTSDGPMDR